MLKLFNQLDGFGPRSNIKVLMATNRPQTLDPALMRPGRLARKVDIVEEVLSLFISRDALSNLGIISKEFPKVHSNMSLGWVARVQGSSADTAIEQPCIKPDNFTGETASRAANNAFPRLKLRLG